MRTAAIPFALLLAAASAAACASPAAFPGVPPEDAPKDEDFSRGGLYLGAYGLQSYENFDTGGGNVSTGDSDLGAGLKLGWRLSPRLAIEAVAEDIQGFSVHDSSANADLDLLQFGVNGKFFLLKDRFQPYALVGAGAARSDVNRDFNLDDDGGYVRAGLGLDVYLTRNFAIFGEANYDRMVGGTSDLDHVNAQLGILFRF